MKQQQNRAASLRRVLLIGPRTPPYGGMALQAQLMEELMNAEGVSASLVASNPPLPRFLGFLESLAGVRTIVRLAIFCRNLGRMLSRADTVHILACSWLYFFLVVYPALVMARFWGKRIILNYRGGEAGQFFRWYGWLAGPVFRLADVVTAPSGFLADLIAKRFQVRVQIIPNILDFSLFRYHQRFALKPKLLVTRHLEKIYDLESVLKAFQVVHDHYPEASLWIAGTGTERARLVQLVDSWKLAGVRFLGHVAHQDLPSIYNQCDIFVNASLVDNFPGALLEASASGLVVVSSGSGGIPHIYESGKTALLVEPGDWPALAAAVLKVLQSPHLGMDLTSAAAVVVRSCEWQQVRKALYSAYGFPLNEGEGKSFSTEQVARA